MKHFLRISGIATVAVATTLLLACGNGGDGVNQGNSTAAAPAATQRAASGTTGAGGTTGYVPRTVPSAVQLTGSGASFPNPFYQKAFDEYNKKVDSKVKVNYQSKGSSGGIKDFTEKTVDFGATDAFLTDEQIAAAGGPDAVLHIPTAIGAVVLTYNLPNMRAQLKFSPDVVAGIFLGDIKKWNDNAIKAENPGVSLPDADIAVVYRADGSGTTSIFTTYLSAVSQKWKDTVGAGTSVKWPTGVGAPQNDGVAGQIKNTPGAIGYVELIYAEQTRLPTVSIKNREGEFVKPTLKATSAAAADLASVPDDLRATVVNAGGKDTYPIAGMTWILVRRNQTDELKATALANLLWWLTHDGQSVAESLQYAPLPNEVVAKVEAKLKSITVNGKPVITS